MNPRQSALAEANGLLLLTRSLCRRDPEDVLAAALAAGFRFLQVREKEGGDAEVEPWARRVVERAHGAGAAVVVNDRVALAARIGADGAHVGQGDLAPQQARSLLGEDALLGLSTHDAGQLGSALEEPVDYLGLGPWFDTATKGLRGDRAPLLAALALRRQRGDARPVFGIGGIDASRVAGLRAAGVERVAVSSCVCAAQDPERAASELLAALRS